MGKWGFFFTVCFLAMLILYMVFFRPTNEFAENDLYNEILQRGYIKVGISTDSKPFGFYDDKGNIVGYDADLAGYIAQYILKDRSKVEFICVAPENRLIKASTGDVDMVISTVTITPQRQEIVSFSKSYDSASQVFMVRKTSAIQGTQDLAGQSIGVIFGTTAEKNIQRIVPTAHIQGFRTYNEAYLALKSGSISAVTSDDTILNRYVIKDNDLRILPRKYSNEPYGIAFKKGNTTVRLKIELDNAIDDLQQRNILHFLRKKWELGD